MTKRAGKREEGEESTVARALGAAFALLIACFLGSTAYALSVSNGIREASERIAANSSPSILRLAAARTELRRLESTVQRLLGRDYFDPFDGQVLDKSMATLDAELAAFRALPLDPVERRAADELDAQRKELREALSEVIDLAATDKPAARNVEERRITPLIERLDQRIKTTADLNNSEANDLAHRIIELRQTGRSTELVLDGLSAAFGLLLLVLVIQSLNRYVRLLKEQQRAIEARANELDDFSGRVAHDIRGPLAALDMALQLAFRNAADEASRDLMTRAQRSLQRATDIVDGLYEFARSGAKPAPGAHCDAKAVLAGVMEELKPVAEAARIELVLETRSSGWVACSVGVLSSIASNLARNAIKYMGESRERRVTLRLSEAGPMMRLEVEDTGPGLPPDFMSVVFEPHARAPGTNQPGLGLGLATVKRLARGHGGDVSVDSTPGKGCCFRVELPKSRT